MRRARTLLARTGLLLLVGLTVGWAPAAHAEVTVKRDGASVGFTLIVSQTTPATYLVDRDGRVAHVWESDLLPGLSASLRSNGRLVRAARVSTPTPFATAPGGQGGRVQELAWDGKVIWSVDYATDQHLQHHDAVVLPNGNVLMLAWDLKTTAEAVAMGRDPALLPTGALWPDSVVEMNPKTNSVVWEWHVWDHLVQNRDPSKPNYGQPAQSPRRIDLNYAPEGGQPSWNHFNSIAYDAERDQVLVSSRHFSEVWIIDHDTTTRQASGPKGDLLFRWGNPAAYGQGGPTDRTLFLQHHASWNPEGVPNAGSILVFNNGDADDRPYSTVDEVRPLLKKGRYVLEDGEFQIAKHTQLYPPASAKQDQFFAPYISGAERLPNGNLLITDGPIGRVFEVTPAGSIVWTYVNDYFQPGPSFTAAGGIVVRPERLFRSHAYAPGFKGLKGKKLTTAQPSEKSY